MITVCSAPQLTGSPIANLIRQLKSEKGCSGGRRKWRVRAIKDRRRGEGQEKVRGHEEMRGWEEKE